jgi:hypothetical protein
VKPRALLAKATYDAELAIDGRSRRMQTRLGNAVRTHMVQTVDGPRLTATSVVAIMREVDHLLLELYPPANGVVECPLTEIIERQSGIVRRGPIDDAVSEFQSQLQNDPGLLQVIERDAANGN